MKSTIVIKIVITKLIILNTSHNPTGYLMNKEKFLETMGSARKHNILVLSDEVYRFLEYDHKDRLPAACDVYDKAVSIGVMSKTFGLAGLRIGWIATRNQDIYNRMAFFKDYTSICNSAPSEFLATVALRHYEDIAQRNKDIILANLKVLNGFFARYQGLFSWIQPKAGSVAFPRLKTDIDAETFCTDVVEKKGVLLMPSNYYDYGNRNFRVGFGRKNMPEAVERFEDYLLRK